jgi:hypothetical protein
VIDKKQMENMECFYHVGSMKNDARCTSELKSRFAVAKAAPKKKKKKKRRKRKED